MSDKQGTVTVSQTEVPMSFARGAEGWTATSFTMPKQSKWQCYLFGATIGNGMVWRPNEGQEPNWFWRKMQYLAFGNAWVKDKD